jgi:hypothetical protein
MTSCRSVIVHILNNPEIEPMIKSSVSLLSVALFGLALVFGAGSAIAGDGKSCGGKKKDGDTAVVVTPEMPRG